MGREHDRGIGQRVAEARKLVGWTQPRLATEANVSVSLVRKVEQGQVPASPAFVSACARALKVSVPSLLGQPYPVTNSAEGEVHAAVAVLRSELAAYDLEPADLEVRPVEAIAADVERIREYRRATNFTKLAAELPAVLTEGRALVHRTRGREQERAYALLFELYSSARSLAHKLGYTDLATLAVERMTWAAMASGDDVLIGASQFHRALVLTSSGDWSTALAYLERCRAAVEPRVGDGAEGDLVVWGGLHLQSGLAAARSGNRDGADSHLAEAREAAARIGHDNDPVITFGPTNVGIWSTALAVEMLDGPEAINRASKLVIPTGTPRGRAGHHYIDLARAFLLNNDRANALNALQTAKQIAPSQTRYHPMVHETVRMLARQEARSTETLRGFAAWCGISR